MGYGILMKIRKGCGEHFIGASKFFGAPLIPEDMKDKVHGLTFLCQIKLEDIAELDPDNLLPHSGYLYFFVDKKQNKPNPVVLYTNQQPDTALIAYNAGKSNADIDADWPIIFEKCGEYDDGLRLLGKTKVSKFCKKKVLLQYDPMFSVYHFWDDTPAKTFFICKDYSRFDNCKIIVEK